jgi:hypothetical protein
MMPTSVLVSGCGVNVIHPVTRLRMSGGILLLPYVPSYRAQGELYLLLVTVVAKSIYALSGMIRIDSSSSNDKNTNLLLTTV